jgi:hypothetical protein
MKKIIALITDFGLHDHFVGTMKGVILGVDPDIKIFDISHQIQPQNILEAGYILLDTLPYWPPDTTFVAVVDPGVGTDRRSLVVRTGTEHMVICPDNGILTLVEQKYGILTIREISEKNRLPGSAGYYTFHGRDLYAYNAARLVSGQIQLEKLGRIVKDPIQKLTIPRTKIEKGKIIGNIIKVEKPFGNLSTNIQGDLIFEIGVNYGESLEYIIREEGETRLKGKLPLLKTFGEAGINQALIYIDSSGRLGFSINQGNFSVFYGVSAGLNWEVELKKIESDPKT